MGVFFGSADCKGVSGKRTSKAAELRGLRAALQVGLIIRWRMGLLGYGGVGWDCGCGWVGIGEVGGAVDHVFPGFAGIDESGFFLGHGERVEHDLAEIGEGGGALGDAVLGQGGEDFAHDVVDVGGGEEVAGEGGGDFCAKAMRFQELQFGVGVEQPQGRVIFMAKHAAAAAVGEGELAEVGVGGAGCGHL
jgi:hypothetical protein